MHFYRYAGGKSGCGFLALLFLVNIATGHGDYLFGAVFSTAVIILFRRIDMGRGAEMFAVAFVVAGLLMVIPYSFYTNGFVYLDERYGNRLTLGFDNPNLRRIILLPCSPHCCA